MDKAFMQSMADPNASRAVTGVSGAALRAACSAFLPGTTASAAVQRKTVCPNLTVSSFTVWLNLIKIKFI